MELEINRGLLVALAIAGLVIMDVDLVVICVDKLIAHSIFIDRLRRCHCELLLDTLIYSQ